MQLNQTLPLFPAQLDARSLAIELLLEEVRKRGTHSVLAAVAILMLPDVQQAPEAQPTPVPAPEPASAPVAETMLYLNGRDAAAKLGVSLRTLQRYAEQGQIERHNLGRHAFYVIPSTLELTLKPEPMPEPEPAKVESLRATMRDSVRAALVKMLPPKHVVRSSSPVRTQDVLTMLINCGHMPSLLDASPEQWEQASKITSDFLALNFQENRTRCGKGAWYYYVPKPVMAAP